MRAGQMLFAAILIGFASTTSAAVTDTRQDSRRAELRDRQREFREMDRDSDGVITRAEWRGNAQSFRNLDANDDGVLSGNEIWVGNSRGRARNRETDRDRPAFADLDRNENGVITSGEWRGTAEEFRALDKDGDGVLTPREYRERSDLTSATSQNSPTYRAGYDRGVTDGRQAGREDKTINGGRWDLDGQRELESADAGYTDSLGPRAQYQAGYRAGFRIGYRDGFGPR